MTEFHGATASHPVRMAPAPELSSTVDGPKRKSDGLADIVDGLIERLATRGSADRSAFGPPPAPVAARGTAPAVGGDSRAETESAPPAAVTSDGLVGRDSELAILGTFLADATRRSDHLMWCGVPGIGKTALLGAAAGLAAPGTLVLRASGAPYEADIEFSALNQLFRPLRSAIGELDAHVGVPLAAACGFDMGPPPDTQLVAEAAVTLLRKISTSRPVLVIVDDLQYVDPASLATIEWLTRRAEAHGIGVLAAYRAGASLPFDRGGLAERELEPLTATASTALLSARFPRLSSAARRHVLRTACGVPLALLELPKVLAGADPASGGRQLPPLTPALSARCSDSVSALPVATRRLLLLAALDETGDLSTLRTTAPNCDVVIELAPATRSRLITVDIHTGTVAFDHAIVRSAIVEMSTGEERRGAHRSLAAALTDLPARHAWHLADATIGPDEHVAALLEVAAEHAERAGRPVDAAWALSRSADLSPYQGDRARRLIAAADRHVRATGELRRASEALAEAGRLDPDSRTCQQFAITAAFLALHADGNIDLAHRILVSAINGLDGDEPTEMYADIRAALQTVCRFGARAVLWDPYFRFTDHSPDEIAAAATYLDTLALRRPQLLATIENADSGSAVTTVIDAITHVALDDLLSGRWDDAQTGFVNGIELCQTKHFQFLEWDLRLGQAMLAAARGDFAAAEQLAGAMNGLAIHTGAHLLRIYAHRVLAQCALGRGEYQTAYEHAAAVTAPGIHPVNVPQPFWVVFDLVEAAVRANKSAAARAHVLALQEAGVADLSPRLRLVVATTAAMAAPAEKCLPLFELALSLRGAAQGPFEHARLQLMYGERLRRARAVGQARAHLTAALATFQMLDAAPWAARAGAELLAAGVTVPRHTLTAPGALTPQEHRVATLAASGLSNRQIAERLAITPRTVSTHLEQIFPKLAINSRSALRAALSQQPDGQAS
jgi:DNA-binding CsgD family transcriptional regulator